MANITGSVGQGGDNKPEDVLTIQQLLNAHVVSLGLPSLAEDSTIGDNTITAIRTYQKMALGLAAPDGRIDVGGRTWQALSSGTKVAVPPPAPAGKAALSGAAWWHANQQNFPNSSSLLDLNPPFRDRATAFVKALQAARASVSVTSTLRHPIRAYLMHYSWTVAHRLDAPASVPAKAGCVIVWDHGNLAQSRAAAQEMVDLFGMAFIAALTSRHIEGHAVDMNISWNGTLSIKDASGAIHALGAPRNGVANSGLHAAGKSFGVHKLSTDPPHWSIDGH
jgi:hypothetical protein